MRIEKLHREQEHGDLEQRVREYPRQVLFSLTATTSEPAAVLTSAQEHLRAITDKTAADNDDAFHTAQAVFIDEVLNLTEAAMRLDSTPHIQAYQTFSQALIASPASPLPDLPLAHRFDISAKIDRSVHLSYLQPATAQSLTHACANELPQNSEQLAQLIKKYDVPEALAAINLLQRVHGGADNIDVATAYQTIMRDIEKTATHPFIQTAAKSAQSPIENAPTQPLPQVITRHAIPFLGKADPDRLRILFKYIQQPEMREFVEQQIHADFAEISLAGKLYTFDFLAQNDSHILQRVFRVTEQAALNKNTFFENFLLGAYDPSFPERLLQTAEKISPEFMNRLNERFQAIITQHLRSLEQETERFFAHPEDMTSFNPSRVTQQMYVQATQLFTEILALAQTQQAETPQIQQLFQKVEAQAFIFKNMCSAAFADNPDLTLLDISALSVEELSWQETTAIKSRLLAIAQENFPAIPSIVEGLRAILYATDKKTTEKNRFIIVRKEKEIIAFLRIEDRGAEQFVASFNVPAEWQSSGMGGKTALYCLQILQEHHTVRANMILAEPIAARYIDLGFIGYHLRDAGDTRLIDIVKQKEPRAYRLPRFHDSLKNLYQQQAKNGTDIQLLIDQQAPTIILPPGTSDQIKQYEPIMEKLLNVHGYELTRYTHNDNNTEYIIGLEKADVAT